MPQPDTYRILVSGGGTGGHIFPALSIANALKARNAENRFLFVGAEGRMEMQKVPEAGYEIRGLNIAGFQRGSILKNLGLPFKVLSSLMNARSIIKEFKPDVIVGVGGYASGPVMWMGSKMGIPVLVQEQNSFAGMTNKLMAQKAKTFCVAYDGTERFFPKERIVKTGNPVRAEIVNRNVDRAEAYKHFGLDPDKKTILIVGGSLGARTVNNALKKDIEKLQSSGYQVLWQTGKIYYAEMAEAAKAYDQVHAREFIKKMDMAYEVADVIISRAGAGTISELALVGKPVILVPSPNVTEDHQTQNALELVNKGAAILVKDSDAADKLVSTVLTLLGNAQQMNELGENISKLAIPDAADRIADEVIKLAQKR